MNKTGQKNKQPKKKNRNGVPLPTLSPTRTTTTANRKIIVTILKKITEQGLIRHVNGNTCDNRLQNLQRVTALQAFQNKGWTVDAVCILTDTEFEIWCKERANWNGDMTIFPAK